MKCKVKVTNVKKYTIKGMNVKELDVLFALVDMAEAEDLSDYFEYGDIKEIQTILGDLYETMLILQEG